MSHHTQLINPILNGKLSVLNIRSGTLLNFTCILSIYLLYNSEADIIPH
jgi:hypothetical protein